mmetsp:Transcript_39793/g.102985  ORF Transcript_39793/g.102985 Transcript_39793/m.102985 type:complete len:226 (+) Transcript_39793:571-1248(+)
MIVQCPVGVEQVLVEDGPPLLPRQPEITTCQEASHCVPGEVVQPTNLDQLPHAGVNEGVPRLPIRPGCEQLWIRVPRDLLTRWIALLLVEILDTQTLQVGHLAEVELAEKRAWRLRVLLACDDLLHPMEEAPDAHAPELQVWGQHGCGGRVESRGLGLWLLEVADIGCVLQFCCHARQAHRLTPFEAVMIIWLTIAHLFQCGHRELAFSGLERLRRWRRQLFGEV